MRAGGLYIYCLDQHGRGIGLENHVKVYEAEQTMDIDTVEAHASQGLPSDARDYTPIIAIVNHFGIKGVRLLTNNPRRIQLFERYSIPVTRIPHEGPLTEWNMRELRIKKEKLGHLYSYDFGEE
jgi:GTP cyclohydrolase II